jgi:hypothetical protein
MDAQVADTLELAGRADVALVGLGTCAAGSTLLADGDTLTAAEVEELRALGVVGDIALQFFDGAGHKVAHPIHERIVGTDLETIKSIPRVIGVAGGKEKVPVIRAALHGGLINVLVTDDQTASQLLDQSGTNTTVGWFAGIYFRTRACMMAGGRIKRTLARRGWVAIHELAACGSAIRRRWLMERRGLIKVNRTRTAEHQMLPGQRGHMACREAKVTSGAGLYESVQ